MNKYLIANWKCNKGIEEAQRWFDAFARVYRPVEGLTIIVAPSFISLLSLSNTLKTLGLENVSLAAQDVSPFPKGSYTGAVDADMVKSFADYVILGHSERRVYFHETKDDIAGKMSEAIDAGLIPIVCMEQPYAAYQALPLNDLDSKEMIVAFGPMDETTARTPEPPIKAAETARSLSKILHGRPVVYGGSLGPENVKNYLQIPELAGLFIGQASLDVESFLNIYEQMAKAVTNK
ncbi:MAG: triosephosphate isomerase [Desulfobulbaceae bacterium]|nr:triosephosphate isomerase [Desulfobulbaceae bacterium]